LRSTAPSSCGQRSCHWPRTSQVLLGRKPINAKAETVASLPSSRDACKRRRCLLPIDNFFEWQGTKGAKTKQPHAIALKSGEPFALAAIWESWKVPGTDAVKCRHPRAEAQIKGGANARQYHLVH